MKPFIRKKLPFFVIALTAVMIAGLLLYIVPGRYRLYDIVLYDAAENVPANPLIGFAPRAENYGDCEGTDLVFIELPFSEWEPEEGVFDTDILREKYHVDYYRSAGKNAVLRLVCDIPGDERHIDIPGWLYSKLCPGTDPLLVEQLLAASPAAVSAGELQDGLQEAMEAASTGAAASDSALQYYDAYRNPVDMTALNPAVQYYDINGNPVDMSAVSAAAQNNSAFGNSGNPVDMTAIDPAAQYYDAYRNPVNMKAVDPAAQYYDAYGNPVDMSAALALAAASDADEKEISPESGFFYDDASGKGYIPDYSNKTFLKAHKKALNALAEWCRQDSFVAYVEMGSVGQEGLWTAFPPSAGDHIPSEQILSRYAKHYAEAFPADSGIRLLHSGGTEDCLSDVLIVGSAGKDSSGADAAAEQTDSWKTQEAEERKEDAGRYMDRGSGCWNDVLGDEAAVRAWIGAAFFSGSAVSAASAGGVPSDTETGSRTVTERQSGTGEQGAPDTQNGAAARTEVETQSGAGEQEGSDTQNGAAARTDEVTQAGTGAQALSESVSEALSKADPGTDSDRESSSSLFSSAGASSESPAESAIHYEEEDSSNDLWTLQPVAGALTSSIPMDELLMERLSDTLSQVRRCHISFIGPECPGAEQQKTNGSEMILRNVGYCIYLSRLQTTVDFIRDELLFHLTFTNIGRAPLYWDWPVTMYVRDLDKNLISEQKLDIRLSELIPGKDITVTGAIPYSKKLLDGYTVSLAVTSPDGSKFITLAQKGVTPGALGAHRIYKFTKTR